jgi:hypothetical protein
MNLAYRKTTKQLKKYYRSYFTWLNQQKGAPALDGITAPVGR